MKKNKTWEILFVTLLVSGIATLSVSSPRLNRRSKTITVGKSYTLRVRGVTASKVKSVKFTSADSKVADVKKKSDKKAIITARKKGKTTVTVKILYKRKVRGKKSTRLKFHVNVKSG